MSNEEWPTKLRYINVNSAFRLDYLRKEDARPSCSNTRTAHGQILGLLTLNMVVETSLSVRMTAKARLWLLE